MTSCGGVEAAGRDRWIVRLIGAVGPRDSKPLPLDLEEPPCPRAEELAAFVDGALEATDRRRVLAHLLDCHRCYAEFREVLTYRLERRGS